jgi:poly(3-hydroxybutyrate) depolymerase
MQTKLSAALIMLLLILSSPSEASVRKVPQDYAKIQQAINAGVDGDTIVVDHGLYYENIRYFGKKIVVASRYIIDNDTSHISKTIIDGSKPSDTDSASVVTFDAGTDSVSEICGFTIQGGKGNKHYDPATARTVFVGGGVDLFGNGGKIVHNQIINNEIKSTYPLGAAISAWDQNSTSANSKYITIGHNFIAKNSLVGDESYGGAVAVKMSGLIQSNIIRDNKASGSVQAAGGGVTIWGNSKISLANNIIARNHSSFLAGAILIFQWNVGMPAVTMINNTICYNTADQGAEGISRNAPVKMLNNIFWNPGDGTEIDAIIWNPGDGTRTDAMSVTGCAKNLIRGGWFGKDIIDADPLFADTILFRLSPLSPAIARGSMFERLDSEDVIPPVVDYLGNLRPNPNGANPDFGAIESEYNQPVAVGAQPKYINRDISYGGNARNTHIFLPRAYYDAGKNFPLMIFLHGSNAGPSSALTYGFHLIADTMNFIIVSPKSLGNGWEDGTETSFIGALIDTLTKNYRVDTNNIFVGGHSSGGYMSYRFGLNSRKTIKGIASVAGLLLSNDGGVRPASPISLISFHSTGDAVVSYSGGNGYLSAEQSLFKWLSYQSCGTQLDTVTLSDPFPENSNTVQRLSSHCSPVVFYKIKGGSHAWPGAYYTHVLLRPTIPDINATLEILRFFQSQTITRVNHEISDRVPQNFYLYQNYPNPFNPATVISYQLSVNSYVTLRVYDLLGREVLTLVNERKDAGRYSVQWDARRFASGIYFYTLQAGEYRDTKRMLLLK